MTVKTPGGNGAMLTLPSSLAGAAGCTVSIGADAIGTVPTTTASYARVCGP